MPLAFQSSISFLKDEMQLKMSPCEDRSIAVNIPVSGCILQVPQEFPFIYCPSKERLCMQSEAHCLLPFCTPHRTSGQTSDDQ